MNGVDVRLPKVYTGPGLSLHHAGLFLLLTTRRGLTLLWDGGQTLPSALSPHQVFALVFGFSPNSSSRYLPNSEVETDPG